MNKAKINLIKNIIYPILGVVFFVVFWHILAVINDYELTLPTPLSAFKGLIEILKQREFYVGMGNSLIRATISCAISFVFGVLLAVLSKLFNGFKVAISPLISAMRSLPTIVITIILLLKTRGTAMPIYVACLVVLPASYSALIVSLNSVDKTLLDAVKVYKLNRLQLCFNILLPSIKLGLIETLASSFSLTFKVIVSAEIIASTANSIGIFMQATRVYALTSQLFASAIAVIFVCILLEFLLRLPLKFSTLSLSHKVKFSHKVN